MVWTRLLYTKFPEAFQRTCIHGNLPTAEIGNRYKAELRKAFRMNGVPWIYDLKQPALNPRHKTPKRTKLQREKPMRIAKLKKTLSQCDQKQLAWRKERLNKRKLTGFDRLVSLALPSHIKKDKNQLPKHLMARHMQADEQDYED